MIDVKSDNFLLFTDSGLRTIFQMDVTDSTFPFTALPIEDLGYPFALTFDSVERKIYWSDIAKQTINRANLDGTEREEILGPYNGIQGNIDLDLVSTGLGN